MPPASRRRTASAGFSLTPASAGFSLTPASAGFSLTEALVAVVVLAIALVGSSGALRGISDLLGRSGQINAMNLAIDNDISEIMRLASLYTACLVPSGSVPAEGQSCGAGITPDQAAYYFPVDPGVNEANITAFFAACNATSASSHITQGFITAIGQLPAVGAGVSRSSVAREAPGDAKNHNVIVRYTAPNSPMQRIIKVAPVVSAWCN
jgi:prepilin-type N-terminal cleavage/methylation domain-containing protein